MTDKDTLDKVFLKWKELRELISEAHSDPQDKALAMIDASLRITASEIVASFNSADYQRVALAFSLDLGKLLEEVTDYEKSRHH
jgi:hypothetical protein